MGSWQIWGLHLGSLGLLGGPGGSEGRGLSGGLSRSPETPPPLHGAFVRVAVPAGCTRVCTRVWVRARVGGCMHVCVCKRACAHGSCARTGCACTCCCGGRAHACELHPGSSVCVLVHAVHAHGCPSTAREWLPRRGGVHTCPCQRACAHAHALTGAHPCVCMAGSMTTRVCKHAQVCTRMQKQMCALAVRARRHAAKHGRVTLPLPRATTSTTGVQAPRRACKLHERARARTRPRVCVCWVPARRRLAEGREALAGPAAGGGGGKCGSDSAAPANTCKQLRAHNGKYRWGTAPPIASDSRLPRATATSTGTPLGAAFPAAPHFFFFIIYFFPPFFPSFRSPDERQPRGAAVRL